MMRCQSCDELIDSSDACRSCGAALVQEEAAHVIAGQYEVERVLGRGGMGVVYLARDLDLGRRVAIKVVAPKLARDPVLVRRLKREAAALASIRHPHVVQVHSFGVARSPYFVMEYVKGRALSELVCEHVLRAVPLPERRAVAIIRQVATALDAVHEAGLVHRDVKPLNIIIEEGSGRPVLVDFGLAAPIDEAPTADSVGCGTPQYMAPEQAPSFGVAPPLARQADVFALGSTAYELLTGAPPFDSDDPVALARMRAKGHVTPPSRHRASLAPFDRVIARALAVDPRDRFPTAAALGDALEGALPSVVQPERAVSATWPRERERDVVRVLVVDDDAAIARYAARAAQLAFYRKRVEVRTAASGEEALARAAVEAPDLVILDYSMPGLDGIETLTRMRDLPGGGGARVLVFSANARDEQYCRFALLGVEDFLAKPVGLKPLVGRIAAIGEAAGWLDGADPTHALSA